MHETSNLAARLKRQLETENAIIQDLTRQQLSTLRTELTNILNAELHTIKADIERQNEALGWRIVQSRVLWPLIVGVSLSLGLLSGSWAMMHYSLNRITALQQDANSLQQSVTALEQRGGKIQLNICGEKRRLCAKVNKKAGEFGDHGEWMILKGY